MTTEQCSVDSLLPKSRTENFARQLQNRLRTLNTEIDRDGPDDTSWNGDQLSSSSDDIYYDLDSPGSPAEEATETNFTDYINVKTVESGYPSSSTNNFFNHGECLLQNGTENYIDYEQVEQYSMSDSINNHSVNNKSAKCVCLNKSKQECLFCGQCTREDYDGKTLSISNDRVNNVPYQNGLSHQNHLHLNGSDNELFSDFNGVESNDDLIQLTRNTPSETSINNFNGIKDRLQSNGVTDEGTQFFFETENINLAGDHLENYNLCRCNVSNNESKPVDVNCNSTASINNMSCTLSAVETKTSNDKTDLKFILNDDCHTRLNDSHTVCGEQTLKHKKEIYTEEDLSRLVDAVFLRSEENDFDENLSQETTEDLEKGGSQNENRNDDDEEETIESKRSRFRRSSSLKTGKTPPGTPGRKKIVRFADVLGLDLADVRTFLDEVPKVPKSAFTDLKNVELASSPPVIGLDAFMGQHAVTASVNRLQRTIVPLFQQPGNRPEFLERIRDNCVCLENAVVTDPALFGISGVVRVKNIDFHKSLHIRYSIDNWKSFADLQAKYVPSSCDGFSDRFTFTLYAHMLNVGQRLEFAIRYHASASIFWDNNYGANYTFQCVPDGPSKVLPTQSYTTPSPVETWASFY